MSKIRKFTVGVLGAIVGLVALAGPASATTTPAPPDPSTFASDILAAFGDKLVTVVTAMASNVWVLALFGLGIAVTIVRRVLSKGTNKASKVVG